MKYALLLFKYFRERRHKILNEWQFAFGIKDQDQHNSSILFTIFRDISLRLLVYDEFDPSENRLHV